MIKAIFAGDKKLLKLADVKFISVPKYDEISVKNLYGKLIELEGMGYYFPTKYAKGRQCDREYLFNVANTLHPQILNNLITHAMTQRYSLENDKQKQEAILISEEWAEELKAMPFISNVSHFPSILILCLEKRKNG